MTKEIEVPQGIQSSSAYIVQYDENLWYSFTDGGRKFCQDTWIKWAEPLGLEEVVLRLIPDPIFPQFGKEKPYIYWRHKFPKVNGGEWLSSCKVTLNTNDHRDRLDTEGQEQMRSYFSAYPVGTKFMVYNLNGLLLWETTT